LNRSYWNTFPRKFLLDWYCHNSNMYWTSPKGSKKYTYVFALFYKYLKIIFYFIFFWCLIITFWICVKEWYNNNCAFFWSTKFWGNQPSNFQEKLVSIWLIFSFIQDSLKCEDGEEQILFFGLPILEKIIIIGVIQMVPRKYEKSKTVLVRIFFFF